MSPSHSALHGNINHSLCPFFLPLCDTAAFASSISQFLLFVATLRGCSCDMRKTFSTIKIYGSSYLGKDGWVKCVSWNLSDAAAASYDLQHSLRLHYIHADFNINTCTVAITLVYSAATWVFCPSEILLDRKLGPEFLRSIASPVQECQECRECCAQKVLFLRAEWHRQRRNPGSNSSVLYSLNVTGCRSISSSRVAILIVTLWG